MGKNDKMVIFCISRGPRLFSEVFKSGKRTNWTLFEILKQYSCHFETDQCPDPESRAPGNKSRIPTIFSHNARTCDKYIFTYAINEMINICHNVYVFIHIHSMNMIMI